MRKINSRPMRIDIELRKTIKNLSKKEEISQRAASRKIARIVNGKKFRLVEEVEF